MPASEPVRWGRKRVLPSCPNPLFLQWLTELRDEAKEKQLKTQFTFQKAINSLTKYPLPLRNAREAKILQNFGDGICKILDDRLQRYYREEGPNAPIHSLPAGAPPAGGADNNRLEASRAVRTRRRTRRRTISPSTPLSSTKAAGDEEEGGGRGGGVRRRKREYVPQRRSGGFAVLLALYRHSQLPGNKGFMLKMELQSEAQRLCDRSFTAPDPGSRSTAWSSVRTLIHKNLVLKTHSPARFSLTDEGRVLAERLESAEREVKNVPEEEEEEEVVDLTGSGDEDEEARVTRPRTDGDDDDDDEVRLSEKHQTKSRKPERLLPGTYDIVLCVDVIETTGGSHHRKQELVKELERNGVRFVVRKLNVGDFLWVAREKVSPVAGELRAPAGRELVLDFIVERKRMDDLCGSIIDGRFREQKFRLKRCGLRRPIYLVEGGGASASHLSLPEATLQQAIVNTQVVDGFFVKRVQDVRESAAYLTIMTRYLTSLYQNRVLTRRSRELEGDAAGEEQEGGAPSCSLMSFEEFNHGAVKNKCQTVREVFARQLMQISGLSGDKAAAVLEHYSTPDSLLAAYGRCSSEAEKEKLLSCIRYGKLKRNVGPALSRTVYQLYCTPGALA